MAALLQKTAGPSPFDVSRLGRNGAPYPEALLNEGDVGALARNLNATQIYLDTHVSHNTEPGLYLATAYTSKDNGKSYQGGTRDPVRPQGSMNSSHVPKSRKKKSTYIVEQTFKVRGANGNTKKYERPLYINYEHYREATGGSYRAYKKALSKTKKGRKASSKPSGRPKTANNDQPSNGMSEKKDKRYSKELILAFNACNAKANGINTKSGNCKHHRIARCHLR